MPGCTNHPLVSEGGFTKDGRQPRHWPGLGAGLSDITTHLTGQCRIQSSTILLVKFCSYSGQKLHQSTKQKSYMVPPTALIQAMLKGKTFSRVVAAARTDSEALQASSSCEFLFLHCAFPRPPLPPASNLSLSELISVKAIYLIFSIELFVNIKLICILPHLSGEGC